MHKLCSVDVRLYETSNGGHDLVALHDSQGCWYKEFSTYANFRSFLEQKAIDDKNTFFQKFENREKDLYQTVRSKFEDDLMPAFTYIIGYSLIKNYRKHGKTKGLLCQKKHKNSTRKGGKKQNRKVTFDDDDFEQYLGPFLSEKKSSETTEKNHVEKLNQENFFESKILKFLNRFRAGLEILS